MGAGAIPLSIEKVLKDRLKKKSDIKVYLADISYDGEGKIDVEFDETDDLEKAEEHLETLAEDLEEAQEAVEVHQEELEDAREALEEVREQELEALEDAREALEEELEAREEEDLDDLDWDD